MDDFNVWPPIIDISIFSDNKISNLTLSESSRVGWGDLAIVETWP